MKQRRDDAGEGSAPLGMNLGQYVVWAVAIIVVTGIMAVTVVMIYRPAPDMIAIMVTMFGSVITVAIAMLSTQRTLHHQINSRMDDLIRTTMALGVSEGKQEGRVIEEERVVEEEKVAEDKAAVAEEKAMDKLQRGER